MLLCMGAKDWDCMGSYYFAYNGAGGNVGRLIFLHYFCKCFQNHVGFINFKLKKRGGCM